jgi:hypothetical protein
MSPRGHMGTSPNCRAPQATVCFYRHLPLRGRSCVSNGDLRFTTTRPRKPDEKPQAVPHRLKENLFALLSRSPNATR